MNKHKESVVSLFIRYTYSTDVNSPLLFFKRRDFEVVWHLCKLILFSSFFVINLGLQISYVVIFIKKKIKE